MPNAGHLPDIVLLLAAAVCIVAIFRWLKLSPVLGYLCAGAAIGPYGLGVLKDVQATTGIAEFGVIFLLFIIGLELSLERLRVMRTHVFGFGTAQVLMSGALIAAFFFGLGGSSAAAVIIGGALALSSTAIVLQVAAESGEKSSQVGRLALAVLILQDLIVVPLLVLVPLLGQPEGSLAGALSDAMLRAIVGLTLIFLAGRLLLRPLFRFVASLENTELFSAATLLVALGLPLVTHMAGLSPALGAFMAGLLVAETEFKPQVEADIMPFKGLFLGLFFMTVGMSLDLPLVLQRFPSILGLAIALMAAKSLIIIVLGHWFGFRLATSIHAGLLLSQGSEFAFVLFGLAAHEGVIDGAISQVLLVIVTVSMALTPLAAQLGKKIALWLDHIGGHSPKGMASETLDLSHHVIIAGYGRVGHTVARLLEMENIPFVAIDVDASLVAAERSRGVPAFYGDGTRQHVLRALGLARAQAVIITHGDNRISLGTVMAIRDLNRDIPVIVRAKNLIQVQKLEQAGANLAVAEMFETSLQLGGALLRHIGVADQEISRIIELFRAEDYSLTREAEQG